MRLRNLLIVHPLEMVQNVLKRQICAEMTDFAVNSESSGKGALELLRREKYDMVICEESLFDLSAEDFIREKKNVELNAHTPLILISSPECVDKYRHLIDGSQVHLLLAPFQALDLQKMVNLICNPKLWRSGERAYLPGTRVSIYTSDKDISAELINLSAGGILCDINYQKSLRLFEPVHLDISLLVGFDRYEIHHQKCRLSRLNVSAWKENDEPEMMRVTLLFVDISDEHRSSIDKALQMQKKNELEGEGGSLVQN